MRGSEKEWTFNFITVSKYIIILSKTKSIEPHITFSIFDWYHVLRTLANIPVEMQIESNFILSTRLSIEGPMRMKEEYVEGIFESPKIYEENIPQQLRSVFVQAASTVQQLPVSIRDTMASGVKIPLGKHY